MNRQHTISTKSIGIAVGDDLQLQPDRPCRNSGVARALGSDLNKCLGAAAVAFTARLQADIGTFPKGEDRRQPFSLGIIVEADRRKLGLRVAALHDHGMQTGVVEARDDVGGTTGAKGRPEVVPARRPYIAKQQYPIEAKTPPLTKLTMADLQGHREVASLRHLKTQRLQPKVVRNGRTGGEQEGQRSKTKFHGASFLADFRDLYEGTRVVSKQNGHPGERDLHLFHTLIPRFSFGRSSLALLLFVAAPAAAHEGTGLPGGFKAGLIHPLTGFDHMLAMISVGLWGAILGRPLIMALPMIFPSMMVFGAALAMIGMPMPPVELGIALSVVVLGAMILLGVRASVPVACAVVALFALFHGYAHGAELPSAADPVGYSAGFVLSTGLLHVVGIAMGAASDRPGGKVALRSAGGGVALCGLFFLTAALGR